MLQVERGDGIGGGDNNMVIWGLKAEVSFVMFCWCVCG